VKRDVALLMGGWSAEREVSLMSGNACADALESVGYRVRRIDVTRDMGALLKALQPAPDAVFNALHGRWGEDGCVQGLLEMLNLPYSHSGVLASALAMDKPAAKRAFAAAGLLLAESRIVQRAELPAGDPLPRPYVIKPPNEGSSVGVRIVQIGDNQPPFDAKNWTFGETVMVESFVPGRELTVAVMGDRPLAVLEITFAKVYDYEAKYTPGGSGHITPAPIHPRAYEQALDIALRAHRALGCAGVSRADIRYDDTTGEPGKLVLLEVNTQPGMTPLSLVPDIAKHCGIPFPELCRWIVEDATCPR
jgi:D-alanine-D-alanine ligase